MIYLDNAATSFPKPRCVTEAVMRCLTQYCGNPGRGAHPLAMASAEAIYTCRESLAAFLGLNAPESIVFTANTTYALNFALKGLLRRDTHVLISELEHNAVRRPLCALQRERHVRFETFPVLGLTAQEITKGIARRITPDTSAVICTHASNICSLSLPLTEIGALCLARGLLFVVDAAQSAGHLPIDMRSMHISALAAPAHKALYGIQGAGLLALGEGVLPEVLLQGGSGVDSLSETMPSMPPERYEAGTLSTPAIVGLSAGLAFIRERGLESITLHERMLFEAAKERLTALGDVRIFLPDVAGAVLLFAREHEDAEQTAARLAADGICVRAGYHCAPLAHHALGTPKGGAVRISFSPFNTVAELDALWRALR